MKKTVHDDVRGVSNSPLTSTSSEFLEQVISGKEVKIDWFQVTFDFIPITQVSKHYYALDRSNLLFRELINLFNRKETPEDLQEMEKGQFGYIHGIYIDEHIWLSFGGKKNKYDKYPMTLTMSGQGCRTFEMMEGNWIELFKFFQKNGEDSLKIGRIDIAIDDFEGDIITPYQILPYIESNHVVTQFRSVTLHKGWTLGESSETKGFTLTLGQRGSNQLQIYDKRLERDQMNQPDLNTSVWYRYEMRFTDEKARQVMDLYTSSVEFDDSVSFMRYAKSLLITCLDIKVFDPSDSNKSRWETLPQWKEFTDSFEKVDLKKKNRIDTTIRKKLGWVRDDLATTFLELYFVFGEDLGTMLYGTMSEAKFERKHLNRMNNYLRDIDKEELTLGEVRKLQESFKGLNNVYDKVLEHYQLQEVECEFICYVDIHENYTRSVGDHNV
ncbi:replication initiation factor domain-containing protein [Acholeplasma equirhinis]|uniref:replication initiation factor domain-containing protein n=1 Tax=Acholeplasma equirhinis TaxID=555393 RepID=UPI00197AAAF9|nr:replication initiation factor domain-containing protein [Acholeplasma equirhinis]MBN3490540.1 replication initiation factor domain-containing protein [Acholeplasma equirhinis]